MSRVRATSGSIASPAPGEVEGTLARAVPVPVDEQRLGPYRLCLELASGGMASIYLARAEGRTGLHRFVAVKRVHPHLASDPAFVEMFLDESRIASLVQHPNVCSVFDFDSVDGEYYLAMEFLLGEPLSAVFRAMARRATEEREPRRAALVARVIADACEGLHAAHELRDPSGEPLEVVHRDVSPENVFLTYDGVVKIVDFGVARAAHQRHLTVPGMLKGKLAYMPPEVLRGLKPDRRADVWGIGVVLWELLTGKRLFQRATDIETLKTIAEVHIPLPSDVAPDVPKELDPIVLRALTSDRNLRYATARELGRDLQLALARRGEAVGLAELSEWMDALFPAGRACKRQLLEIAASSTADSTPPPSRTPVDPDGIDPLGSRPTTVRPAPSSTRDRSTRVRRGPRSRSPTLEAPSSGVQLDPVVALRRWRHLGVALAIVTTSSVAFATFLHLRDDARAREERAATPGAQEPPRVRAEAGPLPVTPRPSDDGTATIPPGGPYTLEVLPSPGGDPNSWMLYLRPAPTTASGAAERTPPSQ